jgi:putative ABC transport system permease protein
MSATGAVAPWRFAARLARREVMRRPWRTVLVVLLVALPVAGMTVASVLARAQHNLTWLEHEYGEGTDLAISRPATQSLDVDELIPAGSTSRQIRMAWVGLELGDGTIVDGTQLTDSFDLGAGSALRTEQGRRPGDGEVWLSAMLADEIGADVGDTLDLAHPAGAWLVAGVGESEDESDRRLMVMPDLPLSQFRDWVFPMTTLIDLPDHLSRVDVERIGAAAERRLTGTGSSSPSIEGDPFVAWAGGGRGDELAPLAWTWVVGTIALAATGIIVAAAFATSARRQLATIGILSANGSPERLTRRALAAQGAWTGLVGSLAGVAIGLTVLTLGRSTIERIDGNQLDSFQFSPLYLALIALTGTVAATAAALVPARTASRVPVMAALAGRRPLGTVPGRLVPRGVGLAALGSLLLVVGVLSRNGGAAPTFAAMVGGVFVLVGMCCCSPLAVDLLGTACGRLSGTWRLAGRGLSRTRTRSAAIVTAIAVIGALTMSGAAAIAATVPNGDGMRELPSDALMLVPNRDLEVPATTVGDLEPVPDDPVPADLAADVEAIVPTARWSPRRIASWDPAPVDMSDPASQAAWWQFVVADEAMLDLYELSDIDREALERTGVLVNSPWFDPDGLLDVADLGIVTVPTESGDIELPVAVRDEVRRRREDDGYEFVGIFAPGDFLITEEAAIAAGFEIVTSGGFLRSDRPLTDAQRTAVQSLIYGTSIALGDYYADVPRLETTEMSRWSPYLDWPGHTTSETATQGILVGVAFVLTLLVVAIGLALAAAEGVAERDVLVAVGGRPSTMRSMAAVKAVVLTVTGLVLAVPFGLLPTYAVLRATDHAFHVPWLVVGSLVVAVPLLAGGITWLVSAIGQRIRPLRISALAFD